MRKKGSCHTSRAALRKGTGGQWVYESLREVIVSLELAPGDGLEENQLVQRFGVSRTPVREALIRLAAEGLAVLLPNRRAKVAPMNLADIKQHLEALDLLQPAVCHWAAVRRTAGDIAEIERHHLRFQTAGERHDSDAMIEANFDLHAATAKAAHNASIERAFRQVLTDQLRIARITMTEHYFETDRAYSGHLERIVRDHREIVQFIIDGDAVRAEDAARRHAELGRIRISDYLAASLGNKIAIPDVARTKALQGHARKNN
jgi:DNA-binding GntR family transcriptional regulator